MTLWSATDPLRVVNYHIMIPNKSHLLVLEYCLSINTWVWLVVPLLYVTALIVAVITIAIKISTIRRKNFQDAKATNAITATIMGTFYWYFFAVILKPSSANYESTGRTPYYCYVMSVVSVSS